jgi:hypothetical protein
MNKPFLIGLFAINTIALTAQTEILNEDFESGAPTAFTIVDNDGNTPNAATAQFVDAWTQLTDPEDPSDTVMGSTSYFSPVGIANRWLITPALTLGSYGNFIYWQAKSHDPSYPDDYTVYVSTTDTQISSFTETVGSIQEENFTWTSRSVNLSANGYANQTIYVAFVNKTDDGFALYLNDIRAEIDNPVGLDELNDISVVLYPNPTSETLKVKGEAILSMTVLSLNGQVLLQSTSSEITVSSLQSGSYLVQIETESGTVTKSFVKI